MNKIELRIFNNPKIDITNSDFKYYTNGWYSDYEGSPTYIDYPSLTEASGTTSIEEIPGWKWDNGYMVSISGYSYTLKQDLYESVLPYQGIQNTYKVTFDVKGIEIENSENYLNTNLLGVWGSNSITKDGRYTEYITSDLTIDTNIYFYPTDGFTGGISNINIEIVNTTTQRLDLYDDDSFNLTFQITSNVAERGATFSKTIKVPATRNNNIILNHLFDESTFINLTDDTKIFFNKNVNCGVYQDSLELIRGYLNITSAKLTDGLVEYEATFYSNSKNLADTLGNKNLKNNENPIDNIDFSEYNHWWKWSNIQKTWNTGSTFSLDRIDLTVTSGMSYSDAKGVYYPLIDWSGYKTGNVVLMENFKPAIYVKEVLDKIFHQAGFTYTSNFLNSNFFKSLILPMVGGIEEVNLNLRTCYIGMDNYFEFQRYVPYPYHSNWICEGIGTDKVLPFDNDSSPFNDYYNIFDTTIHKLKVDRDGYYNLSGNVKFGIKYWITTYGLSQLKFANSSYFRIRFSFVQKDEFGQVYPISGDYGLIQWNTRATAAYYTYDCWVNPDNSPSVDYVTAGEAPVLLENIYLTTNDEIWLQAEIDFYGCYIEIGDTAKIQLRVEQSSINNLTWFKCEQPATPVTHYYRETDTVHVNDCLPKNMKQIDFIKSIANKFNLIFAEDRNNENGFIIEPYDTFYSGNTIDWSGKIDISKEKSIKRIPYLVDKNMEFKLQDDDSDSLLKQYKEITQKTYGSYVKSNPYLTNQSEKVDDMFSGTRLSNLGGTNYITSKIVSYENPDENNPFELPSNANYHQRIVFRNILKNNIDTSGVTVTPITIVQNKVIIGTISTNFPYCGYLDNPYNPTFDLNYGKSLNNIHWNQSTTINNLYWAFWKNKISLYLNPNSKYLTVYLRLNNADIANLNFRNNIILDNNVYQLVKINEWGVDKFSKVELIKWDYSDDSDDYLNSDSWRSKLVHKPINTIPKNYVEIKPTNDTILGGETGLTYNTENKIPKDFTGIVFGKGNTINANNFTLLNSNNNTINSDGVYLFGSNDNYVQSGLTNVVLIGTSGQTINESNTTLISNYVSGLVSPLTTDLDFSSYKAISMVCDNGTQLPLSAVTGQWYLHTPAGRNILFQYNGSSWVPMVNFGTITMYVDVTNGTDNQNYGTGTTTGAFKQIQFAVDQIPPINAGNITINVAAGTYQKVVIQGKGFTGAYSISIIGAGFSSPVINTTCDSYIKGGTTSSGGPSPSIVNDTGAFTGYTTNSLQGYFFTKDDTIFYPIIENTSNQLTFANNTDTTVTTYKVYAPPTTVIQDNTNTCLLIGYSQVNVFIYNIKISSTSTTSSLQTNDYSYTELYNCHIQSGNATNGTTIVASRCNITRSYVYQFNSGTKYCINITGMGKVIGNNSLFAISGGTTCFRVNQLSMISGNPSYNISYNAGLGIGYIINGAYTVIFGQWFKNFNIGVQCDDVGMATYALSTYATFDNCTTNFSKGLSALGKEIVIKSVDGITAKLTQGYNSSSDVAYFNYGSSTTNKNLFIDNSGNVGIGNLTGSTTRAIYVDNNGLLNTTIPSKENDIGTVSSGITINFSSGDYQTCTLSGNIYVTLSNPINGGFYNIRIKQSASGGNTVSWPANVMWHNSASPVQTSTANAIDIYTFIFDRDVNKYIGIRTMMNVT